MLDAEQIVKRLRGLMRRNRLTDQNWQEVKAVREGAVDTVFPEMVSETYPKPIIANFIDNTARDLAEMLAPLPTFNCASSDMGKDAARKFADRRTIIAMNYVNYADLANQLLVGCDHYFTYGQMMFYIEPNFTDKMPRIQVESPIGGYPEYDRFGVITAYTKRFYMEATFLADLYPEWAAEIQYAAKTGLAQTGVAMGTSVDNPVELIRFVDNRQISLVITGAHPIMLSSVPNRFGCVPAVMVRRPWSESFERPKGQFDDVLWPYLARDMIAKLQLSAIEKVVQAPIALPSDVQEFPYGPDAILRSQQPDKIRRVGLELPTAPFTEEAVLLEEMRQGSRYPAVRTGGSDASIITGRGVQSLMGTLDTQIKAGQTVLARGLKDVIGMCFKMDEKYWPELDKHIKGVADGTPYKMTYRPSRDIRGDHSCDVTYGFAAGLDPNRAVVMLLQLRAEKAFSRDYFVRQLPFQLNVGEEQQKVDIEDFREALKQSVYGYAQSIPQMAATGVDPAEAVNKMTIIIDGLKRGIPVEKIVQAAFSPEEATDEATASAEMAAVPGGPGAPGPGGASPPVPGGLPPGMPGAAPPGQPDLNVMLAGLTGAGTPRMGATIQRRRPV
jgi:hypothetical protein